MVGFQYAFRIAATQTSTPVSFAKLLEFKGGEVFETRVLCGPAFTTVVRLDHLDLLDVIFGPLFAAKDYLLAIAFVMIPLVCCHTLAVGLRPLLLVLRYLFFVLFLILLTRFNPMRQVGSGLFVLNVLLASATTVVPYIRLNT